MKGGKVEIGSITRDGKPLPNGTYTLTWASIPAEGQLEEIRDVVQGKNESGGRKNFTVPLQ